MEWVVKEVLVLSPHTDDMELGAAGTVRKLVKSGARVTSLVFSDCRKSVPDGFDEDTLRNECGAAARRLGISDLIIQGLPVREFPRYRQEVLEAIYDLRRRNNFDLVLTTWHGDMHQDHRVVADETRRAFMKTTTTVLAYEVPGNCPGFTPQVFVPMTKEEVDEKIEVLHCYESQVARRGYFRVDAIKSLMGYRGLNIGVPYAEGFVQQWGVVTQFVM